MLVAAAVVVFPVILFILLRWLAPSIDQMVVVPPEHFLIVSAACLVALGMAIVLSVVAVGPDFATARSRAYLALGHIELQGSHYRTDIALRVAQ